MEKSQKVIGLDELRILDENLFQLDHSHVLIVLTAIEKRLVIFPDGLVDRIQFVFICLQLGYVHICHIVGHIQIFADDPLA